MTAPNGVTWLLAATTEPTSPLDLVQAAGVIAGALIAVLTLLGLIGRFVWKWFGEPWLREHLIDPVQQTRHQVTVNHHSSPEPTVLDRIDDVASQVSVLAERLDEHIATADLRHRQSRRR